MCDTGSVGRGFCGPRNIVLPGCIATALDYILLRFPDRDWLAGLPALRDWRARQADRPALVATMPQL